MTLNLVNVPAPQAAKTVLGDILGVKYTVDPSIEGEITIQAPNPVTKSAAVDLFQSALRSNGAAIGSRMRRISDGDTYLSCATCRPELGWKWPHQPS